MKKYLCKCLAYSAGLLFAAVFAFSSCCSKNDELVKQLADMSAEKVQIPYSQLAKCYTSKFPDTLQEGRKYNLVKYVDSSECSLCGVRKFANLENFRNSSKDYENVSLTYIINTDEHFAYDVYEELCSKRVRCASYFDTLGVFRMQNPQIPDEEMFHTFLLDENDSVVLVGDPVNNNRIASLLTKVVKGEIKR